MPRFDHMKGEVSVKNLGWRQGGKPFSPGGEVSSKFTPPHLQPRQYWLLKDSSSPKGPHPRQLGTG